MHFSTTTLNGPTRNPFNANKGIHGSYNFRQTNFKNFSRKWSCESWYPGAFPPVLENFRSAFSPGPTDRPWLSEDAITLEKLRREKAK